ncbi:MAG: DUF3788 domain-containing protein [Treponema sp.]|nr:DUF3788 domain-containing protein [Treponema sp.]
MENQILKNPMIKPDNNVLEKVLEKNYHLYKEFIEKIIEKKLIPEWNYYNDGKSWLCKILNKKKNLCWLSVWNTEFKLTFYFTEKTMAGVNELEISEEIKKNAQEIKKVGKLIPIIVLIKTKKAMNDGIKLLEYKMILK